MYVHVYVCICICLEPMHMSYAHTYMHAYIHMHILSHMRTSAHYVLSAIALYTYHKRHNCTIHLPQASQLHYTLTTSVTTALYTYHKRHNCTIHLPQASRLYIQPVVKLPWQGGWKGCWWLQQSILARLYSAVWGTPWVVRSCVICMFVCYVCMHMHMEIVLVIAAKHPDTAR